MFKDICYLASSVTVPRMCWWTVPLDSVCLLRNPLANGDDIWFEWLKLTKCRLSTSILRRESRNAKNKRFHRGFERILDSIIWIWIWSLSVKPWTRIPNHFWRRQKEQWQIPLCSIYNVPYRGNSIQFVIGAASIRTVITAAEKQLVVPFPWQQAPSLWQHRLTVIQMITSGTEAWH